MNETSTKKKATAKKSAPASTAPSTTTASVQQVFAEVAHLGEVAAILRGASTEFVSRFSGVGSRLPELFLRRDGSGARHATVAAIIAAESALERLARDLDKRALALVRLPVEVAETVDPPGVGMDLGVDRVVHRDHLEGPCRPAIEEMPSVLHNPPKPAE